MVASLAIAWKPFISGLANGSAAKLNSLPFLVVSHGPTIRGIVEGNTVLDDFIPRLIDLHMNGRFPFDG